MFLQMRWLSGKKNCLRLDLLISEIEMAADSTKDPTDGILVTQTTSMLQHHGVVESLEPHELLAEIASALQCRGLEPNEDVDLGFFDMLGGNGLRAGVAVGIHDIDGGRGLIPSGGRGHRAATVGHARVRALREPTAAAGAIVPCSRASHCREPPQ